TTLIPALVIVAAAVGGTVGPGLVVVLAVIRVEVALGKAVVGDQEVDRVPRLAAVGLVEVRRARDAGGQLARRDGCDASAVLRLAEGVAIDAVPLRPTPGKAADLEGAITAGCPGLGDEVDARAALVGPARQLIHGPVERVLGIELVELEAALLARVAQHRGQVEAEAVDTHRVPPVVERVDDE